LDNAARLVVNDDAFLGSQLDSVGRATVTGIGTLWDNGDDMAIGDRGLGILEIFDGGRVIVQSLDVGKTALTAGAGEGYAYASGELTRWEITGSAVVGTAGRGFIEISDGARVSVATTMTLGDLADAYGSTTLAGVRSQLAVGTNLVVGDAGVGSMEVLSGSRLLVAGNLQLAAASTGHGELTVSGIGSEAVIGGALTTSVGVAKLYLKDGGALRLSSAPVLGVDTELHLDGGELAVDTAGTTTNRGLIVGGGRLGTTALNNSVTGSTLAVIRVEQGDALTIAGTLSNAAFVEVLGGELAVESGMTNSARLELRDGVARFGGTGLANGGAGQLSFIEETVDVYGDVSNAAGGEIVVGRDAYAVLHDDFTTSGSLHILPGGTLLVLSDLALTSSASVALTLDADVQTTALASLGTASLDGSLAVSLAEGYLPSLGDSFAILSASESLSGQFTSLDAPALASDLQWSLQYLDDTLTLSVVAGLASDFDQDGDVDSDDLAAWEIGFGTASGALSQQGDADGDGDVDGTDWLILQREFGSQIASSIATSAVPEPSAWLLASAGIASFCRRRR
ncbi:MAG: hypothetical protein KDA61_14840, partial [Planctomycetales bacterium]|nr:hypothetical protein [Planctomycetales bacterium]